MQEIPARQDPLVRGRRQGMLAEQRLTHGLARPVQLELLETLAQQVTLASEQLQPMPQQMGVQDRLVLLELLEIPVHLVMLEPVLVLEVMVPSVLRTGQTKQAQLEPLEMLVQQVTPARVQGLVGQVEPHPTHGQVLLVQQAMLETLVLREAQELEQLPAILAEPLLPTGLEEPELLVTPELLVLPVPPELELVQVVPAAQLLLTGQASLVLLAMLEELLPQHRS